MLIGRRPLVASGLVAILTVSVSTIADASAAGNRSAGQDKPAADRSPKRKRFASGVADAATWQARRRRIEKALKQDRLDEADLEYLRYEAKLTQLPSGAERAEWWMLGAEIHYRRDRFPQAVLSAMKVVILAPRTGRADEGLCWAAQAYEKLGRPELSIRLYRECLDRRDADDAARQLCKRRLAALKKGEAPS